MTITGFIRVNALRFKSMKCVNPDCKKVGQTLIGIRSARRGGIGTLSNMLWLCRDCALCAQTGEIVAGRKQRGRWRWLRDVLESMQRSYLTHGKTKTIDLTLTAGFFWRDALDWLREEVTQ